MVPVVGVEPTLSNENWILSPARLPIPPHRQIHFKLYTKRKHLSIKKSKNGENKMEVLIIGGIAAGMSVAAKAQRTNKEATITVIEKENFISFGACGLPYYVGKQFEDSNNMFARTPEQIEASGINLLLKHEVIAIDFDKQTLTVKNLKTDEVFEKKYDKLMIATGATPIIPPIDNIDATNVYTMTKLMDADRLKNKLDSYKHLTIVGGGFIGIEMAEQLNHLGKKVTLIQAMDRLINKPFDPEFSEEIKKALEAKGITVLLNEKVENLEANEENSITYVQTNQSKIDTDAVIIAIGFKPNTRFLTDERLRKLENGAIIIDTYGQTSIPNVFSAGDCATIKHRQLGDVYLPLATTANKMGRLIGTNIVSPPEEYMEFIGTLGSSAIKAGDFEAATSGLTEEMAKELNLNYKTTYVTTNDHTNYWPNQEKLAIKLVYQAETKVLLGAQILGKKDAVLRMTGLTTAIHAGLTTDELGFVDFSYAPPFSTTWEAINVAANTAK